MREDKESGTRKGTACTRSSRQLDLQPLNSHADYTKWRDGEEVTGEEKQGWGEEGGRETRA